MGNGDGSIEMWIYLMELVVSLEMANGKFYVMPILPQLKKMDFDRFKI